MSKSSGTPWSGLEGLTLLHNKPQWFLLHTRAQNVSLCLFFALQCSRNCGGGSSTRDVQCVDTRDLRPLRPFHCQPGPTKPPTRQLCGTQPCLPWYTSSWREVRSGPGEVGTEDTLRPWLYLMPLCSSSVLRLVVVVNNSVW